MAKQYYDVYIRPAGAALTIAPAFDKANFDDFYKLELPREKPVLTREPELTPLGDGTQRTDSEKVTIDCGTLQCDKNTYAFLRSTFHNKSCDFILVDHNSIIEQQGILTIIYGIRVVVGKTVESGSSIVCSISGSKSSGIAAEHKFEMVNNTGNSLIVTGYAYKEDGVTPVPGVVVTATIDSIEANDTTDANGYYLLFSFNQGSSVLTATKAGGWVFPDSPEYCTDPLGNVSYRHDFIATSDGS